MIDQKITQMASGVTSHGQPGNAGGQGPKTVKGAQSDPNYVSRLLLDCVAGGGQKLVTLLPVADFPWSSWVL